MRLKPWNWQQSEWGEFTYSSEELDELVAPFREKIALLRGMLIGIDPEANEELRVNEWVVEAISTSIIEGEMLNLEEVRSSVRRHLGLAGPVVPVHDLRIVGVNEMLALARKEVDLPLRSEDLCSWQEAMLSYRTDLKAIGHWRTHPEPMQVLSGPMGSERIHFEAPPSVDVPALMEVFLSWFNDSAPGKSAAMHPIIRAGIAHLWFESIHPFEDGNGRIGRAVAEKALAQDMGEVLPFSLSMAIDSRRKEYYAALEKAQSGNEITPWLVFFTSVVLQAVDEAVSRVFFVIRKAKYLNVFKPKMNNRQQKAILRMFDAGPNGFEGGMNARKYTGITRASKATATRDLQDLVNKGALTPIGQGRGVRYELVRMEE